MSQSAFEPMQTLFVGTYSEIQRGRRVSDGAPVVIKRLLTKTRSPERIARLRHEHGIIAKLENAGARNTPRAAAFVAGDNDFALVTYDIGGTSLEDLRKEKKFSLEQILTIAGECCKALIDAHAAGVVHKDIKPRNIVFNADTQEVQLIDFGLAAQASRDATLSGDGHVLEGTLTHMAPEQTGRLQVRLDRRIDLYGLGATLYDLLTGRPPFALRDRGQMIHDLLTAHPANLRSFEPSIPEGVEQVVLKLLQKNPGARYKSAYGLLRDLEHCRSALRQEGVVPGFALAEHDRTEILEWPQETLGREVEIRALAEAARPEASQSARVCTLQAAYGMGKTAVLRGVIQQLRDQHDAWHAVVSCAPASDKSGLHGIADAIDALIRRMLMGSEQEVELWRRRTRAAMGSIGDALAGLVPVLHALVGEQPKLVDLGPRESENRLLTCLQRLLGVVAEHKPMVLCLDDAHAADPTTIRLLQGLEEGLDGFAALSFIFSYDPEKLDPDSAVGSWLKHRREHAQVVSLQLQSLTPTQVATVLQVVLAPNHDAITPLAQAVYAKTLGKSGAVRAFTEKLWRDGILCFNVPDGRWRWDLTAVNCASVTDDVAAYVVERMANLSATCREVLSKAACLGDAFHMAQLQEVVDDPEHVWAQLAIACEEGVLSTPDSHGMLHFTHRQVRLHAQAALSDMQACEVHTRVARRMRAHRPTTPTPVWLCDLAEHTNAALRSHPQAFVPQDTAEINLEAARAAYQLLNYPSCIAYVEIAIASLATSTKKQDMDIVQAALALKIQGHMGMGDAPAAQDAVDLLNRRARSVAQKVFAAEKTATWQWVSGQYAQSLETNIARVRLLGEHIPQQPKLWHVALQRARFVITMWRRGETIESLAEKPFMTDPQRQTLVQALRSILLPASLVRPYLLVWSAYRLGELTVRYGFDKTSPAIFSAVLMQAVREGRFAQAHKWAACLRRLAQRSERPHSKAYIELIIMQQLEGLTQHPQTIFDRMEAVARVLVDHGDYSGAIWAYMSQVTLLGTMSLDAAAQAALKKSRSPACMLNPPARAQMEVLSEHMLGAMQGTSSAQTPSMDLDQVGKRGFLPMLEWICIIKFSLAAGHYSRAYFAAEQLSRIPFEKTTTEIMVGWQCALVCIACTRVHLLEKRGRRLPRHFFRALARLRQVTSLEHCRLLGAATFIEAEQAALASNFQKAGVLYEQACGQTETSGFLTLHAICTENAGRYFKTRGLNHVARTFIAKACETYEALGVPHKSRALKEEFCLAVSTFCLEDATLGSARGHATRVPNMLREMTQAVASERSVGALAKTLHRWVAQSVSATRVVVFLGTPDAADAVRFDGTDRSDLPQFLQTRPPIEASFAVVDVSATTEYAVDTYFAAHGCTSFGYVPIMHKGRVDGWVYYESSDARDFLAQTLLILEALAGQTALAMENAAVQRRLEQEVEARTRDERQAKEQLFQAANDHAELQMAGGFAHEIRNAVASARFALGAVFGTDANAPKTMFEEARAQLAAALEQLSALEKSEVDAVVAATRLRQQCSALLENKEATISMLHTLNEGVDRAMAVTTQVLEYAEAGRLVAGDYKTRVEAMLNELLKSVASDLQARGAALVLDIAPGLELPMREDHAFAILRNLLANARDAVCEQPQGTAQHHVTLRAREQGRQVVVSVVDTGSGMSAASQARIFQPFFSTKGSRGTGLGLGLSRKLAKLYGGKLEFSSQEGSGTTFTLSVPHLRS